MNIYILKNNINSGEIIDACTTEERATQLKNNLILTGQYKSIAITSLEVNSDTINPLTAVAVEGKVLDGSNATVSVSAINPSSAVTDTLTFAVDGAKIEYTGKVNLTTDEKAMTDADTLLAELKPRIKTYVVSEFSKRLLNDN